MNKSGILKFLKALSATNVNSSGKWVQASCPLAPWTHQSGKDSHPSFAIEIADTSESKCNCFTCGGGDLTWLVLQLKHYGAKPPRYDLKTATEVAMADGEHPVSFNVKEWGTPVEVEEYVTLPELWLATFMPAMKSPRARKYLHKRGLDQDVIEALDLRYDTDKDTICFPIRDFDGVLCGLRGRRLAPTDDQPRYHLYGDHEGRRNTQVWYGEAWLDFDQPLVIAESVFDAASVFRVYRNVCAPMSVSFSEARTKRLKGATEIITLFDNDKAGTKARQRMDKYLPKTPMRHLYLPEGVKDPGECTVEELIELLRGNVRIAA